MSTSKTTTKPTQKSDTKDMLREWLTDEIVKLLGAVPEPHAPKKRMTIIRLAFAKANQQPFKDVFNSHDTASEVIWYTKWRYVPEIVAAFDACYKRALQFADEETVSTEDHYRRERKKSIARCSAKAPDILLEIGQDKSQDGRVRNKSLNDLLGWADPDVAEQVMPNGASYDHVVREVVIEMSRDGAQGRPDSSETHSDVSQNTVAG